jgi:hypothetical protein
VLAPPQSTDINPPDLLNIEIRSFVAGMSVKHDVGSIIPDIVIDMNKNVH